LLEESLVTANEKEQLERFVSRIIEAAQRLDDSNGLNRLSITDIVESARALRSMLIAIHTAP
jgi:hypothetical protein